MAEIPVSGSVLIWARTFRGLSELDAAQRLGITLEDLRAYESGLRKPTLGMFENFATKYRLPEATLFRATRPKVPPAPNDYRTLESRRARHSFDYTVALSNVRTWLHRIDRTLIGDADFSPPVLLDLSIEDDPARAGERERRRFGVSVDDQLKWRSSEGFRRWRAHLEKRGIFVFQQKFPVDDCRGFTLYETERTPTIVVNKSDASDAAKIFTLMHEYCHLLLRKPGISDHNERNPVETFCNKFAAAFLIPAEALRRVLPYWPNEPVDWSLDSVSQWARMLKVSRQALALRMEQAELAPKGFGAKFQWTGEARAPKPERGPSYVITHLSEIGGNFIEKIVGAFDRGLIDEVETTEALGLSFDHLPAVRDALNRQRELTGAAP